jgi:hypothetical protein
MRPMRSAASGSRICERMDARASASRLLGVCQRSVYGRMADWSSLLCVLFLLLLVTTSAASAAAATRAGLRLQLLASCCADGFQIVVGHGCVVWCAGRGSETITCYSGTE